MKNVRSDDVKGFRFVLPTEKETMMTADWQMVQVVFPDINYVEAEHGPEVICCDMERKIYRDISQIEYYSGTAREMDDFHYNLILRSYNESSSPLKNRPTYIG